MPLPPKPSHWTIFPGVGKLKNCGPIVSEGGLAGAQPGNAGMMQTEKAKCEMRAWLDILQALARSYCDVWTGWGADPPPALEYIWSDLASAYYVIMWNAPYGAERNEQAMAPFALIKSAKRELALYNDPDESGITLIGADGKPVRTCSETMLPWIASRDLTLFPGMEDEATVNGVAVGGSIEEFQRLHFEIAQTPLVLPGW